MAFAVCLCPCTPNFKLNTFSSPPFRRLLYCKSVRATAVEHGGAVDDGAAMVWFKHDLRADDHPGLVEAVSRHRTVVPVYVFDPRILSRFSDEMLELLLVALEDLRKFLKDQGSDMLIGYGNAEDVIMRIANEVKATHIYVEEEVEYDLQVVIGVVDASLSTRSFTWGRPSIVFWRTPLYDIKNWKDLPALYAEFQKLQLSLAKPVAIPTFPVLNKVLDRGDLPTISEVKVFMTESSGESYKNLSTLKELSAKAILAKGGKHRNETSDEISSTPNVVPRNKKFKSMFTSREGSKVKGGMDATLDALSAYLKYLEATSRDDWQELHDKVRLTESREGASFSALFGAALLLGTISRRRVYHEAIKYEKERNGGFISPFGYSAFTVAAAVNTITSMEWYEILALRNQTCNEVIAPIRIWRWKGHLIQYTVGGCEGPPVLLVHGFGAFLEHFRGNVTSLAENGHRVWAITLLGFGKSEKPNVVYTELMWAELLRDFIIDVVGEPVHLVGNSIGGYFVASVAGLWPALVRSVILINTAGAVIPGYSYVQSTEAGQPSGLAWLGTRLLLLYLRSQVQNILKKCYPVNEDRADSWLIGELRRASYDPGVLIVLESVFNFKLQVPLNYFLDSFGGKVLIIQGMKDPLSNSNMRLAMFRKHCSWVKIKELDAGHCPHDEVPENVNGVLMEWIETVEKSYCFAGTA